ncbi:thiamine pyrophosphate-requiring protein [Deinococcus irradiatisoli]|uniref:Thiamine pyrophosphate-requiring protein n=1 Tax=Deinococcus irradiatisoli TaxID=2202254 RepID=A0A2Z3JCJ6_9DEIO|nr:thiamine pyrophosphate-requiring protein [Deinococcus irradiatisoli]AWN22762.1 thiamine pyrophosphate-requiring protein [Deinococcus irradiatisoli]
MSTVSDFVIQRLKDWSVSRVFGFPGDGIGAFDGALGRAEREGEGLKYIRPTHEELCALMATAHAKFTGEVGVCVATSSPGGFHLINGLYDAKMDNQPVVAIVGQQGLASLGTFNQQESNLERTFADVAVYVQTIVSPQQAQAVIDTAFRTARTRLQPAVIILPHDVQAMEMQEPGREHWVSRSSAVAPSTSITPPESDLVRAAGILNAGKKVALLVGHGANGATDDVLKVAELTGAGIITALRGKQVVPSDVPYHTQQLGLLGSRPSLTMMKECDTLLLLGTNYPYGEFLPESGQARAIQVDLKPEQMGLRYPTEVNLWGDVKATLAALIPHLETKTDLSWQDSLSAAMRDWEDEVAAQAQVEYEKLNPRLVFHELNKRLPPQAIVTCDAGTTADWYGHHIRLRRGMLGDLSGRLATMLAAMPYALAAKFAYPERSVICTIGDGAFQMLGMNELITIKKYMHSWDNPQLIILVAHNDDLTQVSWEMRTEDGNPLWETAQDVQTMDYAGYAELFGFKGIRVKTPEEVGAAWDAAFAHRGVTLIDAYVSKDVPPIPAHITREYALNTAKALIKGDPEEAQVIVDSAKALITEGVERVKDALHIGGSGKEGEKH